MSQEIIDYPYPLDLRWKHIKWMPFFAGRWCKSRFAMFSDLDVRGVAFSIFAIASEESPPATVDSDLRVLASCLHVSEGVLAEMMTRSITPLHGWVPVRCGKEVRLSHPVMLEALEIAVRAHNLRQRGTASRTMWSPPDAGRASE